MTYTATIDGKAVDTAAHLSVLNPATEEIVALAPDCGVAELDAAVDAARRAFPAWRATPIAQRQAMVKALGEAIKAHKDELMRLLTSEQGKPHADATGDVLGGAMWCKVYGNMDLPVQVTEDSDDRRVEVRRTPIGVVGALAPWNFPVILAMLKAAPALVAGNTVVLKPSPFTPLTTLRIGELARDIFPAGVLNVLSGGDALGPLMTAHPGIDKISFTGSTATGRKVMESASAGLKRVTLELGGNDAAIVLPDVDVDAVAKQVFAAAFGNSGQICVAVKRLYIHADIYDRFAAALTDLARAAKVGDGAEQGTRFGPMQNSAQFARVKDMIADAKAQGYDFLIGGDAIDRPGYFLPLTLIDNPPEDSRIVQEEQFGPVLPLLKWRDADDVVARANATEYGLGGQVWGGDVDAAIALGDRLETGNVFINQPQAILPHAPFGGHKSSGIGSESALDGLLAYTNAQTVMVGKRPVAA
ncbi:aldehyde dehydrogenase [Sphingomonas sp. Leaf412]|uniref:aldehyde dehydrogenase family protein n=1 Tax=Sphingomonas sp. Leaf412 TaxID=1736370 RepID=UPI0006F4CD44|nr:aldehyde dehydrogenase family protein [Sphingomonas sp. Leaf412]KQT35303.1 aldehyde dehydrogenase [Sphingomonas sp. Leaf412]